MAPNQNFDKTTFLVGSVLVKKKGFIKIRMPQLASAFGTSSPTYVRKKEPAGEVDVRIMVQKRKYSWINGQEKPRMLPLNRPRAEGATMSRAQTGHIFISNTQ